jgi:hypothetical protein
MTHLAKLSISALLSVAAPLLSGCAQEGPGIYDGDPSSTCNEVCAAQALVCDAEHVWSTSFLGFSQRGGGQRSYGGLLGSRRERFTCDEVPPSSIVSDGEVYEGRGDLRCACIDGVAAGGDAGLDGPDAAAGDAGPPDAGRPDAGPPDAGPPDAGAADTGPTGPTPGIYSADLSRVDRQSCDEVCADQSLICNGRHVWDAGFPPLVPRSVGGGATSYGDSSDRNIVGCGAVPADTVDAGGGPIPISAQRCSCIVDPGGLINDVALTVPRAGTYQAPFTVAAADDVFYSIFDHYRNTPNAWTVAMVPAGSLADYLAGAAPVVYGRFTGGATRQSASLPAGDYVLVLQCQNEVQGCAFSTFVDYEP